MTTEQFLDVIQDENRMLLETVLYSMLVCKNMTIDEAEKLLLKTENEVAA